MWRPCLFTNLNRETNDPVSLPSFQSELSNYTKFKNSINTFVLHPSKTQFLL